MKTKSSPSNFNDPVPSSDSPLTESEYIKIKEGMQEFRKTFKFGLRKFKI